MRGWPETALKPFGSFDQPLINEQPPVNSSGGFVFFMEFYEFHSIILIITLDLPAAGRCRMT